MKRLLLFIGLLLLFAAEILRVYFIMPFPGSQHKNTISLAYWISNNITWIRILALVLLIFPLINIFKNGRTWKKIVLSVILVSMQLFSSFSITVSKPIKCFISLNRNYLLLQQMILPTKINWLLVFPPMGSQSVSYSTDRLSSPGKRHYWQYTGNDYLLHGLQNGPCIQSFC